MDVIEKPTDLVFIWACLKRCFDYTISDFLVSDAWSWKEFAEISRHASPTGAYYWTTTANPKKKRPDNPKIQQCKEHRLKVTRLILRTAKECWLPRRELIEDEYIKSMNETFMRVPSARQVQERCDLETASKIAKFKRQLGGFYLVWALYWNQPTVPEKFQHIEITPHDYETMKTFQDNLKTMPIYLLTEEGRAILIQEVEFMMNQLCHVFAYTVCVFAEEYNLKDMTYLTFKYNGKAEILEWEKSLKERLLFHPKLREAVAALKNKKMLEKEAGEQFDKDFVAKALDFLKKRASGSKHNDNVDNRSVSPQPGSSRTTASEMGSGDRQETKPSHRAEGIEAEAGPLCNLVKLLIKEVMERPYSLEDLVPPRLYKTFVRTASRRKKRQNEAKGKKKTSKETNKSKPKPKPPTDIDCGNVDNLTPVLQAMGLTPNINDRLDPALSKYFSALLRDQKKCSSSKSQDGRPKYVSHDPQEMNLIYSPRLARPSRKKRPAQEDPQETSTTTTVEPNGTECHVENLDNTSACDMPTIDEPHTSIKHELPPASPFEPNLNDLDIMTECEQALEHMLSPARRESSPAKRGFETPEQTPGVEPGAHSEDEEANVEEILQKLTSFPGLLGELQKTPQKKRKTAKASLKVAKRAAKLRKLF